MIKSIRSLINSAPYSIAVILTLAVGIGASGALFTVINSLLIKPLPYRNPSELVLLSAVNRDASAKLNQYTTSVTNLLDWRERSRAFQSIAGMQADEMAITGKETPEQVVAGRITANLFDTLGVQPYKGRFFHASEETDFSSVAIVSYAFWRDSLGSSENPKLKLQLNNISYQVVGVAPPEFFFGTPVQLYTPLNTFIPRTPRTTSGMIQLVGRMKAGVSLESANSDIQRVAADQSKEFPTTHTGWGAQAHDIRGTLLQNFRPVLVVLTAGVFLLLLISCTNAANLVIARSISMQNEIAIRLALGAGRKDLFLQIFTEQFLMTLTSGVLGFLLTIASVRPIVMLSPLSATLGRSTRLTESMAIDWRVPVLILVLSILISLIFSLLPVIRFTSPNLGQTLRIEGRGGTGSKKRSRLRDLMVVSEIAMACLLLTAAGWIVQRFWNLNQVDPGLDTSQRIVFKILLPSNYDTHEKRALFLREARTRLAAVPGFQMVGASSRSPLNEFVFTTLFNIEGRPPAHTGEAEVCNFKRVSSSYFRTSGISILNGREFQESDAGSLPIAIVSREFEKHYWPGQSAIGKRIIRQSRSDNTYRTIIGVAEDVKDTTVWEKANPTLYVPYEQGSIPNLFFIIRTGLDLSAAKPMIESAIWSIDRNLPVTDLKTMKDLFAESLSRPRFAAYLIAIFAFLGIFLAAVGVYGTVSYSIHQRKKEIGIRMAMGGYPKQIRRFLLSQGFRVAVLGVLCGLLGTLLLSRLTNRLDYAGNASLLPAFCVSMALTLMIWAIASSIPASKASKLDPSIVLK